MPIIPPAPPVVGTSIALPDTMTTRDTVLGVAGVLEIKAPLAGVITHQVLVAEPLMQGEVCMEVTMAAGVAMTTIRPADLRQVMIATLRVVIVTAIVAAEVVEGTAPVPLPSHLAVIHLHRDLADILLVHHKEAHMAVPRGSIRTPHSEEVMVVLITTAVVLALAPAPLDKDLQLTTVMDHRLVVVVVVVVVVRTAADRLIVEVILVPMVPRPIPAEVEQVMTSQQAMEVEALRMGVLKLL